jgi:hypothetical protein
MAMMFMWWVVDCVSMCDLPDPFTERPLKHIGSGANNTVMSTNNYVARYMLSGKIFFSSPQFHNYFLKQVGLI